MRARSTSSTSRAWTRTAPPNADEANKWNDLRLLIRFEGGEPGSRRVGGDDGAGAILDRKSDEPVGAARIEFGQYRAWQVGMHRNNHEALVQTGGDVTISAT